VASVEATNRASASARSGTARVRAAPMIRRASPPSDVADILVGSPQPADITVGRREPRGPAAASLPAVAREQLTLGSGRPPDGLVRAQVVAND
jgi:hypothetical protein